MKFVKKFEEVGKDDVALVGGKNASLGEMIQQLSEKGVNVPSGFAITAEAYRYLLKQAGIDKKIEAIIEDLDTHDMKNLSERGEKIRNLIKNAKCPPELEKEIRHAYVEMEKNYGKNTDVAVRSSATAEDLPTASFAGQQETYLNVRGADELMDKVMECFASLFTNRAIFYRVDKGFDHSKVYLSVGVQKMVDAKAAGVVFTVHRTTGWPGILVEANWGLGESVVSGKVTPDYWIIDPNTWTIVEKNLGIKERMVVYDEEGETKWVDTPEPIRNKFCLSDKQVIALAKENKLIEIDYRNRKPDYKYGDGEFAVDKQDVIWELQHRPETVYSQKIENIIELKKKVVTEKVSEEVKKAGNLILRGGVTGSPGAVTGRVSIIPDVSQIDRVQEGDIIVTVRTDPDWVPAMKRANGIITDVGGTNCHAAIVSSELGIPCIIGSRIATEGLSNFNGEKITLDADNRAVYKGELPLVEVGENIDVNKLLRSPIETPLGLILSNINAARKMWPLSKLGEKFLISLLRIEFTLMDIGVHVRALEDYDSGKLRGRIKKFEREIAELTGRNSNSVIKAQIEAKENEIEKMKDIIRRIEAKMMGYPSGKEYFISKLSQALATFASVFPRSPVIVRTTDFKTNEYGGLIGGELYEPVEANPMLGWRGIIRSLAPENREVFKWELEAIKRARESGYRNIQVMFPMVRDPLEINGFREYVTRLRKEYARKKNIPGDVKKYLDMWDSGWRDAFEIMKEVGLEPGKDDFQVGIMVEVPTDATRIKDFINTGINFISFGTNDLTQFTLAVDRDNELLQYIPWYTEANSAVVRSVQKVIEECNLRGIKSGICGRAPTTVPGFAEMLVNTHIGSVGVEIAAYTATWEKIAEAEERTKSNLRSKDN